jgi:hypothetical protein
MVTDRRPRTTSCHLRLRLFGRSPCSTITACKSSLAWGSCASIAEGPVSRLSPEVPSESRRSRGCRAADAHRRPVDVGQGGLAVCPLSIWLGRPVSIKASCPVLVLGCRAGAQNGCGITFRDRHTLGLGEGDRCLRCSVAQGAGFKSDSQLTASPFRFAEETNLGRSTAVHSRDGDRRFCEDMDCRPSHPAVFA